MHQVEAPARWKVQVFAKDLASLVGHGFKIRLAPMVFDWQLAAGAASATAAHQN
jgi:hypothetical protein